MPTQTFPITSGVDDQRGAILASPDYPPAGARGFEAGNTTVVYGERSFDSVSKYFVSNILLRFDTSALPDDAIIISAKLLLTIVSVANADGRSTVFEWYDWSALDPANDIALEAPTTNLAASVTIASAPTATGSLFTVPLSGAGANVSRTGFTHLRSHTTGGKPTGFNRIVVRPFEHSAETAPKLVVEYSVPEAVPASHVRNADGSYTATYPIAASDDDARSDRSGSTYPPPNPGSSSTTTAVRSTKELSAAGTFIVGNGLFRWDTSDIPDDATVKAADFVVSVIAINNADGRDWVGEWFDWSSLSADNRWSINHVTAAAFVRSLSSIGSGSQAVPMFSSRLGNIRKDGYTEIRTHVGGSQPTGLNNIFVSSFDGTGHFPMLRVTYTMPQSVVDLPLLSRTAAVVAPSVAVPVTLTLPFLARSALLLEPSGVASVFVTLPALTRTAQVFEPSVSFDAPVVSLPLLSRTAQASGPSLSVGTVVVGAPLISRIAQVLAPEVSHKPPVVVLPMLARTARTLTPTLSVGTLLIDAPFLSRRARVLGIRIGSAPKPAEVQARRHGALLSGRLGTIHYTPRLFLSNIYGDELSELPGVTSASVSLSNFRDNTWELALEARATDAFDPARDYVMCAMDVRAGSGPAERFPLGLYRFSFPAGADEPEGSTWDLTGESLETLLMRGLATGGFRVAPGVKVLASVRNLLAGRGVPGSRVNFPPDSEDVIIKNGLYFDPVKDAEGAYFIRIANALLASGGFGAIQTNARGQFVTSKNVSLEEKNPSVLYAPPAVSLAEGALPADDMLIRQPIPRQPNYDRFANEVLVSSEDVNQEPAISAYARNENPNSDVSIQNLGYTVTKHVSVQTISSVEVAQRMADAELARSTAFHMVRAIQTMPDPRRGADEAYRIIAINQRRERVIDDKWLVNNWSMDLSEEPGEMTHEVARTESF